MKTNQSADRREEKTRSKDKLKEREKDKKKKPRKLRSKEREELSGLNRRELEETTGTSATSSGLSRENDRKTKREMEEKSQDTNKPKQKRRTKGVKNEKSMEQGRIDQRGTLMEKLSIKMKKMMNKPSERDKKLKAPASPAPSEGPRPKTSAANVHDAKAKILVTKLQSRKKKAEPTGFKKLFRAAEDVFITKKSKKLVKDIYPTCGEAPKRRDDDLFGLEEFERVGKEPFKPIGNFDNNGVIFVGDRPFWFVPASVPTEEDLKNVEESPECNSETLLEISTGKLEIVPHPALLVEPDPYAEQVEELKEKDGEFFNMQVVFGNTMRSMINTTVGDNALGKLEYTKIEEGKDDDQRHVAVTEPENFLFYEKGTLKTKIMPFEHRPNPPEFGGN